MHFRKTSAHTSTQHFRTLFRRTLLRQVLNRRLYKTLPQKTSENTSENTSAKHFRSHFSPKVTVRSYNILHTRLQWHILHKAAAYFTLPHIIFGSKNMMRLLLFWLYIPLRAAKRSWFYMAKSTTKGSMGLHSVDTNKRTSFVTM